MLDRYGPLFPDDLDAVADAFDCAADRLRTTTGLKPVTIGHTWRLTWVQVQDSNLGRRKPTDLQSISGVCGQFQLTGVGAGR